MDEPGRISVVVCTHDVDRFAWLERCVESVLSQRPRPVDVVVVVDHNPALLERARARFPSVLVVENAEGIGLSGGRNTGVRATTGDIVAFIDDDAAARPGWLSGLASAYSDEMVVGVGGWIVPAWQTAQPSWFPEEYLWVVGCSYRGLPTERATVRNMIGCNMSFRRSVFDVVGGFRGGVGRGRGLPLGCEETELCIRATTEIPGARIVHEPGAVVDHLVPEGRGRIGYFLVRCMAEGISKAYVVRLVGRRQGMAAERSYAMRTLTTGIGRALRRPSVGGLLRAAAIPLGLAAFGAGYVRGMLRYRVEPAARVATAPLLDE